MLFGFLGAPATFQAIMEEAMGQVAGGVQAAIYIDDVHPYGDTIEESWQHTCRAIQAIVEAGM